MLKWGFMTNGRSDPNTYLDSFRNCLLKTLFWWFPSRRDPGVYEGFNKSKVVQRCLYSYRQRYSSSQRSRVSLQQIFNTVMTNIVVDKSTDNYEPLSIQQYHNIQRQRKFIFQSVTKIITQRKSKRCL